MYVRQSWASRLLEKLATATTAVPSLIHLLYPMTDINLVSDSNTLALAVLSLILLCRLLRWTILRLRTC